MPDGFSFGAAEREFNEWLGRAWENTPLIQAMIAYQERVRELEVALNELRHRMLYHCGKIDGTFDPPFVTEWYTIAATALTGKNP